MKRILVAHWKYFLYVFWHKIYVGKACFGYGLYWAGIIHDWSKFTPSEWFPYVDNFFLNPPPRKEQKEGHFQEPTGTLFDYAWLYHQRRNPHHWQYWILVQDKDPTIFLEMPRKYAIEMVCDWEGAGLAQGKPDIAGWYIKNRDKIKLHPRTRELVEIYLGISMEHEL